MKYEFVEGVVVPHAGASRNHDRVAKRIFASLLGQVDEAEFDVNKGNFGVRIEPGDEPGSVLLPDVVVDHQSDCGGERATTTAVVVVEVLSRSIDLRQHVDKLAKYARLASLVSYAVVSQDEPEVHLWRRTAEGWPVDAIVVKGTNAVIEFPEVDATISLSDVYAPLGAKRTRSMG